MKIIIATLAAIAFSAMPLSAAELAGHWKGTWTKADDPLPVTVTFARSGGVYAGSFGSDALQRTEIPFQSVSVDGARITFVLAGDATVTVFEGAIEGDTFSGTFAEGETKGVFRLVRAAAPPPVKVRAALFENGAVKLAGDLILPARRGRRPAILFLHGSGDEGRFASRYFAEKFAQHGFVALIYDKRGVGASTGDWRKGGFEELAADAAAGIRFLKAQAEVDPERIGIYGHSQGGTIAPLVAARAPGLRFIIVSAGSGLDPADVEFYSITNFIGVAALPPAERADAEHFVREIVDVAYKGKSRDHLDAMIEQFRGRSWYFEPPAPENHYWRFSKRIADYQSVDYWRQVRTAAVLLLYGAGDERVPPKESAAAIQAALNAAGNDRLTLRIFPNADHTYSLMPQSPPGGWPKRVPDYVDIMVNWAKRQ